MVSLLELLASLFRRSGPVKSFCALPFTVAVYRLRVHHQNTLSFSTGVNKPQAPQTELHPHCTVRGFCCCALQKPPLKGRQASAALRAFHEDTQRG